MGYFSNGIEGELFYEGFCAKCWHDRNETCPVWAAHLIHNDAECNKPDSILHMLIPKDSDSCNMFVPTDKVSE